MGAFRPEVPSGGVRVGAPGAAGGVAAGHASGWGGARQMVR